MTSNFCSRETRDKMLSRIIIAPPVPTPPPLFAAPAQRHRKILLQQPTDDEDDEADEGFLEEIERALQNPGSAKADTGLRIQRALNRPGRALDPDGFPSRPTPNRRDPNEPRRFTRESTQLFRLPSTLRGAYDDFLERPGQPLLLGSLALLVGFYLAGSLSTIFGAAGFWEPTIALGPLTVTELITRRYYSRPLEQRSQTIRLLNAMKVGFYLGIVIDALKLAG